MTLIPGVRTRLYLGVFAVVLAIGLGMCDSAKASEAPPRSAASVPSYCPVGEFGAVMVDGLRIRTEPNGPVLGLLYSGDQLRIDMSTVLGWAAVSVLGGSQSGLEDATEGWVYMGNGAYVRSSSGWY